MIAHNGEINTVMGNRNWMRAREALLASDVIPGDLERLFRSVRRTPPTQHRSTKWWSCCISAVGRYRMRCS
jgi:glutamate synthase domain-containing protein 1